MPKCPLHQGRGRPPKDCKACAAGGRPPAKFAYKAAETAYSASSDRVVETPEVPHSWPPRWLTPVPEADVERGDGDYAAAWISTLCHVTEDSLAAKAGQPLVLRRWQTQFIRNLLARTEDGFLRHRMALMGVARKNAKSTLSAALGLFGLLGDPDAQGSQIYSCAGDKDQARVVFNTAKRMVEMEPELVGAVKTYRDSIYAPATGNIYKVVSSEAYTKEGLNPNLVIFDEVHVQKDRDLWDVMAQAMGARAEPLMLGITTAGNKYGSMDGSESLAYRLYEYGIRVANGEVDDPTFFFCWYEPTNPEADHHNRETWIEANPGFGDFVAEKDFVSTLARTPEYEFRQKRCNQWTTTTEAWLPYGAWDRCKLERAIPPSEDVVLAFDGSWANDATAIVVCWVGDDGGSEERKPHIDVVKIWEPDRNTDPSWRVPIAEVEEAIRAACRRWNVLEIAIDPARWSRTFQLLEDEGLPVVEFPQSSSFMTPATQSFYEAVVNRNLTQSGDLGLTRHISNAHAKVTQGGMRIAKENRMSARKIDGAVAAVMAHARAAHHQANRSGNAPLVAWV